MARKTWGDLGQSPVRITDATAHGLASSLRWIVRVRSNPAAETGDPSQLSQKLLAFGVEQFGPSEVGLAVGKIDLRVEIVESSPPAPTFSPSPTARTGIPDDPAS